MTLPPTHMNEAVAEFSDDRSTLTLTTHSDGIRELDIDACCCVTLTPEQASALRKALV